MKGINVLEKGGTIPSGSGWRWMFLIGALPALMVIFTKKYLREPETWQRLKDEGRLPKGSIFAPYAALLADKRWRKNLIAGALIASTGVVGLWAIGEYAVDLQSAVFKTHSESEAPAELLAPIREKRLAVAQIPRDQTAAIDAAKAELKKMEARRSFTRPQ